MPTRARRPDDAASPVIAVILMVAVAVALAAAVYGWTATMGARESTPTRAVALMHEGALAPPSGGDNAQKTFLVSAAAPGMRWSDLTLQLGGAPAQYAAGLLDGAPDAGAYCVLTPAGACAASLAAAGTVDAGDRVRIEDAALDGARLHLVDRAANAVLLSLTVQ